MALNSNVVSIPQGTIKSVYLSGFDTVYLTFQFHKVRLKVLISENFACAIEFQFHKVRLKVSMRW